MADTTARIAFVVPKPLVQTLRTALEEASLLDHTIKTRRCTSDEITSAFSGRLRLPDQAFYVPSRQFVDDSLDMHGAEFNAILQELPKSIRAYGLRVKVGVFVSSIQAEGIKSLKRGRDTTYRNFLDSVFDHWRRHLQGEVIPHVSDLLSTMKSSSLSSLSSQQIQAKGSQCTVCKPMMLFQASYLKTQFAEVADRDQEQYLPILWQALCKLYNVTHLAANGPIPQRYSSDIRQDQAESEGQSTGVNVLRSPTRFVPLWGDFGPLLPLGHDPRPSDFDEAFWCGTTQNDIHQSWAPRYAMFSRGNLSEKIRVQRMASAANEDLTLQPRETSAVDLYAGIGYFAFSYASAGVGKVLCWELNPWSIEGLRRRAGPNGWQAKIADDDNPEQLMIAAQSHEKLLVFPKTNECAADHIKVIRHVIPPIRHVNCGYLPTSEASWKTAVQAVDPVHGGWIHAHENIAQKDIETRRAQVVDCFVAFVSKVHGPTHSFAVTCDHVERVKSYGPGVIHCVLDMAILPRSRKS